ncbi:MAG: hypothetical protein OXC40_00995 [Proteobacteria bacterium]|nr:hypothetical protein [Pseudomonadota bacterium]
MQPYIHRCCSIWPWLVVLAICLTAYVKPEVVTAKEVWLKLSMIEESDAVYKHSFGAGYHHQNLFGIGTMFWGRSYATVYEYRSLNYAYWLVKPYSRFPVMAKVGISFLAEYTKLVRNRASPVHENIFAPGLLLGLNIPVWHQDEITLGVFWDSHLFPVSEILSFLGVYGRKMTGGFTLSYSF